MEALQIATEVLAPYLKKSAAEIADILNSDNGKDQLTELMKGYQQSQHDRGYQSAEGKAKDMVEAALRKRGVKDAKFDALNDALDAVEANAAGKAGNALSDEDALKLPAVKRALAQAENEKMTAVEKARSEAEGALTAERAAFVKEKTDAEVKTKAAAVIAELNPIFNEDPQKAARQRERLLADIVSGKYEVKDGDIRPVKEDGTYLPDGQGHPVSFADHVRTTVLAEYDLPKSAPRDSPSLNQRNVNRDAPVQREHFKGELPKTQAEYLDLANNPDLTLAARKELAALVPELAGE